MLGPIRFNHIEDCTREVCKTYRVKDEMDDAVSTLIALDETLSRLRSELESLSTESPAKSSPNTAAPSSASAGELISEERPTKKKDTTQDYSDLKRSHDLARAKRLITARENSIKAVQNLTDKAKAKT
jgi:transposase